MSKRILIIDDNEDILNILNIIFIEEGYDVMLYNTGTSAEHIKILHPDLVLLDVRISGFEKTGVEICKEIKLLLDSEKMPVILISAEDDLSELAYDCKADGYISKPFDIYKVLSQVKTLLQ